MWLRRSLSASGSRLDNAFSGSCCDSLHDRWFTAGQALEYGFIDRVVDSFDQVMPARRRPAGIGVAA